MTKSNLIKITAKKDYCTVERCADGAIVIGQITLQPEELKEYISIIASLLPENKEYAATL